MENVAGRDLVEAGNLCERKNGRGVDPNRNWDIDWGVKEKDYDPKEEHPGKAPLRWVSQSESWGGKARSMRQLGADPWQGGQTLDLDVLHVPCTMLTTTSCATRVNRLCVCAVRSPMPYAAAGPAHRSEVA